MSEFPSEITAHVRLGYVQDMKNTGMVELSIRDSHSGGLVFSARLDPQAFRDLLGSQSIVVPGEIAPVLSRARLGLQREFKHLAAPDHLPLLPYGWVPGQELPPEIKAWALDSLVEYDYSEWEIQRVRGTGAPHLVLVRWVAREEDSDA
jgi:hypothetical protein